MRKWYPSFSYTMRFLRKGCRNRPVYHIVVIKTSERKVRTFPDKYVDYIGVYDPIPNRMEQCIVGLDYDRVKYWLAHGVELSDPMKCLLGKGFFYYSLFIPDRFNFFLAFFRLLWYFAGLSCLRKHGLLF